VNGYRAYYPTSPMHIGRTMGHHAMAVYVAICHYAQSKTVETTWNRAMLGYRFRVRW